MSDQSVIINTSVESFSRGGLNITMRIGQTEVGRLTIDAGVVRFGGNKAVCAEVWFDRYMKTLCDSRLSLKEEPSEEADPRLQLYDPSHVVGTFYIKDWVLRFRGDLSAGARDWFEGHLKPLTDAYLLRNIQGRNAKRWLAEGFVPYTDHMNNVKWTQSEGILDAELLKRIQKAREPKPEPKPET